jgi:hypothetical protein
MEATKMTLSDFDKIDDDHPIDLVEQIVEHRDWDFERIGDDQITFTVEGRWKNYEVTLAWSAYDQILRLILSFEMEPPDERLPALYECLNGINDMSWAGAFTYWAEQKLMVYRYGLLLAGDLTAGQEQVDTMINAAVLSAERFYPAFQLVMGDEHTPAQAIQVAIKEAYGRA